MKARATKDPGFFISFREKSVISETCCPPSPWLMQEACKMGIPAIISADAHHYSEISLEFEAAEEALKQAGYRSVVNLKDGEWVLCEF